MESYGPEERAHGADNSSYCGTNDSDCSIPTVWNNGKAPVQAGGRTPNGDVSEEDNHDKRQKPQLASGRDHIETE